MCDATHQHSGLAEGSHGACGVRIGAGFKSSASREASLAGVKPPVACLAKNASNADVNAQAARKYTPMAKLPVLCLIQPTMKGPT